MRVAIIAEGRGDLAVLTNILKGATGVDQSDIQYLLPEYQYDQTDLFTMPVSDFSNWTLVMQECRNRLLIDRFFGSFEDDNRFIIIHIDTAERHLINYEVNEPPIMQNAVEYCAQLRTNVISKINFWLENKYIDKIAYAIAIEEIEAWILAINGKPDTSRFRNPKAQLLKEINDNFSKKKRQQFFQNTIFDQFYILSKPLAKQKLLKVAANTNESLNLFCLSLQNLVQG